jgi:hypothetical protein
MVGTAAANNPVLRIKSDREIPFPCSTDLGFDSILILIHLTNLTRSSKTRNKVNTNLTIKLKITVEKTKFKVQKGIDFPRIYKVKKPTIDKIMKNK